MKNLVKLSLVLAIVFFTANIFASEIGMSTSNMKLYSPMAKSKSSSSGGIQKGDMQLDVSFNLGSHGGFGRRGYYSWGYRGVGFIPGATINFDYAVHPYASVGAYLGFGGRNHTAVIGTGVRAVFHIYQLISDKAGTKVDPGKLDFYFPFHVGAIISKTKGYKSYASATVGGGFGVRYYFTKNVGIMSEVGWLELAVFKVGAAFKF
ncbi:MAG: hypothetical protein R2739_06460 [Chitinophagales bacterium]